MDERLFICVIKEKPILYDYAKIINIMRQSSQAHAHTREGTPITTEKRPSQARRVIRVD